MIITWLGLLLGVGAILVGQMLEGGHLTQLIQPTAALIVFGGTLGATMLSSTVEEFSQSIRVMSKVMFGNLGHNFDPLVKQILEMASVARKEGILGLEGKLAQIKNPFLGSNLRHVVDGYDPTVVKDLMEDRIGKESDEKLAVAKVWEVAGGFSPTIGIIGAVLGLIHVMANLSDSSKLGEGIAVAFVATVYGVGAANLVLLPIANKLKKIAHHEMIELELIYTGILGIQSGLNPRVIEDRLYNIIGGGHGQQEDAAKEKKAA